MGTIESAGPSAKHWRMVVLPLALVILCLVAMVVVLATIGRQTREQRTYLMELVGPANASLSDLQRLLALELAARTSPDPDTSGTLPGYEILRLQEAAVYDTLQRLVAGMGEEAAAEFTQLRRSGEAWHDALDGVSESVTGRADERAAYTAALAAAARLRSIIQEETIVRRASIAQGERREDRLLMAMVLLAAICLGVLFRVGLRLHSLTVESTHLTRVARQHEQDLERAGREKEVFVRGITHDLKNPIGAIDAYAELLEMGVRGDLAADQKEMVKRIRRCAQQTLRIISDLLDLARGDAAALPVYSQEVDVNHLISDAVEDYRAKLESSGFVVKVKPSPEQPRVLTDGARLREILGNLLMNAAKHTPPGGEVVVAVEAGGKDVDRAGAVAVKVSDTGPGIPDDMRDKIFEEFMRGAQSKGDGIGLSISRKMARALGGDLVLSGASKTGATFALIVPNAPAQPQRQAQG